MLPDPAGFRRLLTEIIEHDAGGVLAAQSYTFGALRGLLAQREGGQRLMLAGENERATRERELLDAIDEAMTIYQDVVIKYPHGPFSTCDAPNSEITCRRCVEACSATEPAFTGMLGAQGIVLLPAGESLSGPAGSPGDDVDGHAEMLAAAGPAAYEYDGRYDHD